MKRTRLIAVGACAIDHILTVPHFPEEDSKLRAQSFIKRRGGNTPNTLEVLRQLIDTDYNDFTTSGTDNAPLELFLIVTLPARASAQVAYIASSLNQFDTSTSNEANGTADTPHASRIDLSHCVYRKDFSEPITSYIISSACTSSRTIINHNALPEMTFEEFVPLTKDLLNPSITTDSEPVDQIWFHFEGRIPETTLKCIKFLREQDAFKMHNTSTPLELKISVELEKPGREGLQDLAYDADVVFYSKAWARGEGHHFAADLLKQQADTLSTGGFERTLICPWGNEGAYAIVLPPNSHDSPRRKGEIVHSLAYKVKDRPIVDSTGAGDTFIAGVLFGSICRCGVEGGTQPWSLKQILSFANELAGRKILQEGFRGLGETSEEIRKKIDRERSH